MIVQHLLQPDGFGRHGQSHVKEAFDIAVGDAVAVTGKRYSSVLADKWIFHQGCLQGIDVGGLFRTGAPDEGDEVILFGGLWKGQLR